MRIHKEGYLSVLLTGLLLTAIAVTTFHVIELLWIAVAINALLLFFLLFIIHFFRIPMPRTPEKKIAGQVISPCDGKVVAIEKITETEYFRDERIQVSVFMSPLNVHINWYPAGGRVVYSRYYKGKHLVAWHPKSSELNERTSVVVKHDWGHEIMYRQVAGAVARRVVSYAKEGYICQQGEECGFIKFGSRVDLILPTGSQIEVKIGDKVTGGHHLIAVLNHDQGK